MVPARRSDDRSPVLRATPAAAFWWGTVLSGAAIAAAAIAGLLPAGLTGIDTAFWVLLAFIVLGELRPVIASSSADPQGVNLGTAFVFATLLLWGLGPALLTVLVATTIGELSRRKPPHRLLFNLAQYTWSYLAAWGVLLLAGWEATVVQMTVLRPVDLLAILLAAVAYHATNLSVVGTMLGLLERRPVWEAITEDLAWFTGTTGAVVALAPLVAVVATVHWGFLPLLLLPLSLLLATASLAVDRERRSLEDDLTGLANRTALTEQVARLVTEADGTHLAALCLIDLDRFKEVNDTLGHSVGDQLLAAVAGRLAGACRSTDTVARLGGDEFVLLLTLEDPRDALLVAGRALASLRHPFEVAGVRLEIEASAGVASLPDHGEDLEVLLRRADVAMYEAKERGETLVRFELEMEQRVPLRSTLLSDLRRGLLEGELELWYQPQVAARTGEVLGVEALLRWHHPTRGLLLPGAFLPLVERTATMREITSMVLEQALSQLAVWQAHGRAVPVAINASLHDLADRAFVTRVTNGLQRHGVCPSLLRVEITEQALVSDPVGVHATLEGLHRLGIELALDDFGTGHASLTRLKRLPVDEVKIDRAFVTELGAGEEADVAIVRAIVDLARACGLRTIAEGVESDAQRDRLVAIGCEAIQGWLIAPAMPARELEPWLEGSVVPLGRMAG